MTSLVVLLAIFAAVQGVVWLGVLGPRRPGLRTHRDRLCVALAGLFFLAAATRLGRPDTGLQLLPPWLPFRLQAVYAIALFELLGAVGLLIPRLRRPAGWGLIVLLVVVFAATVYGAAENLQLPANSGASLSQWVDLALRPVLIGVIWWAATRPVRGPGVGPTGSRPHRPVTGSLEPGGRGGVRAGTAGTAN
jgi:uncharacterized membrane protein